MVCNLGKGGRVPQQLGSLPLLPVLKWSREAEMSADNAGLICCRDVKGRWREVLAALMVGTGSRLIGDVNVDLVLSQRNGSASQASFFRVLCSFGVKLCKSPHS